MSVNGVGIKVGQVWQTRDGGKWRVVKNDGHETYPWDIEREDGGESRSVDNNGFEMGAEIPKPYDLMFLVSDPDVGVERRKRQTENSPLRRKDDYPAVPDHIPDLAASPEDFVASIPGALDESSTANIFSRISEPLRRHFNAVGEAIDRHVESVSGPQVNLTRYQEAELSRMLSQELISGTATPAPPADPQSALDVQVGGGHYKQFVIQPVEFIHKNGIPFIEGNCIKYLCRSRDKGGVQDLEKVKHYLDLLIEMETKK